MNKSREAIIAAALALFTIMAMGEWFTTRADDPRPFGDCAPISASGVAR